jgi:hypothetical protein
MQNTKPPYHLALTAIHGQDLLVLYLFHGRRSWWPLGNLACWCRF